MSVSSVKNILEILDSKKVSLKQVAAILAVYLGTSICLKLARNLKQSFVHRRTKQKVQKFRITHTQQLRDTVIESISHIDESLVKQVITATVVELKEMLAKKLVTSEDLVNIFSSRAVTIGVDLSAITDMNYKEALEIAKNCDKQRQQSPETIESLPLFGIPISIKESIDMKGFPSSLAVYRRVLEIKEKEGLLLTLLRSSGAIPFVRTNVPQFTMTYESHNFLYGTVLNPWDITKFSGGSSGGEGSAIASGVSPIGLGTDIGGSIRNPSAFCGIYGFKPTVGRIPLNGTTYYSPVLAGKTIVRSTSGPMGKCVDDLVLVMQALTNTAKIESLPVTQRDIYRVIKPFDQTTYKDRSTKLRIGYFKTFSYFDATLANQRGVEIGVEALRQKGHEVIEIEFPLAKEIMKHFLIHVASDNLQGYKEIIGNDEAFGEEFSQVKMNAELTPFMKKLIVWLLKLFGENRLSEACSWTSPLSAADYLRNCDSILKLRQKMVSLFEDHNISAILSPSFCHPALAHHFFNRSTLNAIYNILWNVVNLPSGIVPVTVVKEDEQHYKNSSVKDKLSNMLDERMRDNTKGMPIGVQVATLPFADELCLNLMKQIEEEVNFYREHPLPIRA